MRPEGVRQRAPQLFRLEVGSPGTGVQRHLGDIDLEQPRTRPGREGDVLVELLERSLDAVVLRAGLARTTARARQAVTHLVEFYPR